MTALNSISYYAKNIYAIAFTELIKLSNLINFGSFSHITSFKRSYNQNTENIGYLVCGSVLLMADYLFLLSVNYPDVFSNGLHGLEDQVSLRFFHIKTNAIKERKIRGLIKEIVFFAKEMDFTKVLLGITEAVPYEMNPEEIRNIEVLLTKQILSLIQQKPPIDKSILKSLIQEQIGIKSSQDAKTERLVSAVDSFFSEIRQEVLT